MTAVFFFVFLTTNYFSNGENVRMSEVKSSDILRLFTGEGDLVTWLYMLKLVAKLQKIEDVATLIPKCLVGECARGLSRNGRERPGRC